MAAGWCATRSSSCSPTPSRPSVESAIDFTKPRSSAYLVNRRTFLSALAPGLAGIAGCTDGSTNPDGSSDDAAESDDQTASSDDQSTSDTDGTGDRVRRTFFYHEVIGTAGPGGDTITKLTVTVLVPPETERAEVTARNLVLGEWDGNPNDSETATSFVHADAAGQDDHSYALHDDVEVDRYEQHEGWPAYEVVVPLGADGPGAGDNSEVAQLEPSEEPSLGLYTEDGIGSSKPLNVPDSFAVYEEGDEVGLL